MNGSANVPSNGLSRLDSAIDRIASSRPPYTSSRSNSASSSSRQSINQPIPSSADPVYTRETGSTVARRSMQSDVSHHSDHINAQLYGGMPPPAMDGALSSGRPRPMEDWAEKGASRRIVQTVVNGVKQQKIVRKGVRDFNFARTLGEGSYSTVIAATDRQTLKEYAIKVLDKRHIIKEKKVKYVNIEKNTLFRLGDHPGVVRLYYTFQDESSLYFVLDLATNGELLGVLKKLTTFDEECARYYSAQILDAIDYMHSKGVIHRDLKPENVLLNDKMRVKIADFGTAKLLDLPQPDVVSNGDSHAAELEGLEQSDRANSFVGTAEYVSPELLTEKSTCKSSDLWALGCILYQLINGKPPFKAGNEYQTFQKIVNLDYTIPNNFPPKAADLIKRLLVLDPIQRLSVPEIRAHEFFEGIDWETLWKIKAPKLRPYRPQPTILFSTDTTKEVSQQLPTRMPPIISSASSQGHLRPSALPSSGTRPPSSESLSAGRPRSHRVESNNPSELDLQYSAVLSLPTEHILRLGQVTMMTSEGDKTPRKFNKLLQRKKTRTLMVTTHGRCLFLESSDDKKVRGEMALTGPGSTSLRKLDEKQWVVDTPVKSYLYEDSGGHATDWIQAIEEANIMKPPPHQNNNNNNNNNNTKIDEKEKRKSRIGFGH